MWPCSNAGCKLHSCVVLDVVAVQGAGRKKCDCILCAILCSCILTNAKLHRAGFECGLEQPCGCLASCYLKMLVGTRAVCTHSVLPLCASYGKELAKHKGLLFISCVQSCFHGSNCFLKMTTLRSGLLKEVWCNEDKMSVVVPQIKRDDFLKKRCFFELSGLQG